MKLTTIEYDAVMIAIGHSKDMARSGNLSNDMTDKYTNNELLKALDRVETKILEHNIK